MINLPIALGLHSEVSEAGAILSRDERKESSKTMTAQCIMLTEHGTERPAGRGPQLQEKPAVLEAAGKLRGCIWQHISFKEREEKIGLEGFNCLVESTGLGVKGWIPGPVRSPGSFVCVKPQLPLLQMRVVADLSSPSPGLACNSWWPNNLLLINLLPSMKCFSVWSSCLLFQCGKPNNVLSSPPSNTPTS